jgi:hypothetical protein
LRVSGCVHQTKYRNKAFIRLCTVETWNYKCSFSFESVMRPGEISEFQWERQRDSTRIPTTFQGRTRPKARLGWVLYRRRNSIFF